MLFQTPLLSCLRKICLEKITRKYLNIFKQNYISVPSGYVFIKKKIKISISPGSFILRLVEIAHGRAPLFNEAGVLLGGITAWCSCAGGSDALATSGRGSDVQPGNFPLCHGVFEFHTKFRNQKRGSHRCFLYRQCSIRW